MRFYSDYKYIGARKPFDYPEDIHFSNNRFHLSGDELNKNITTTSSDFTEHTYDMSTDFGGYNEVMSWYANNWKTIGLAIAFGIGIYLYNKKK